MAKQLRLDVAQLTDVGRKREHNEDNMAYVIPKDQQVMKKKGALFIVADGMGGHAAGEVASEIAVDTVSNAYYQDDGDDVADSLLRAIRRANSAIHQRASENMLRSGMGTTCVAAILRGNRAYIANVGDSRAYLIHGNQIKQISRDHSWVAEQVRAGLLTEDQARTHAQRNVITRCLGTQAEVEIDVFPEQLEEGDSLILCTDGLSGLVGDDELKKIVEQFVPQESVYHLVERANENGGPDNITAIVVHVHEVGVEPPSVRHPVRVGGRIIDTQSAEGEDTKVLELLPGSQGTLSARNGEMRTGTTVPLHISSGPLASDESTTAPQLVAQDTYSPGRVPPSKRNRLFYPSLALLVLILVALVGGGIFYFIHRSQDVQFLLQEAQTSINQAKNGLSSTPGNPVEALQQLAQAQDDVHKAQKNYQLSTPQNQLATTLLANLTQEVRTAIDTYNASANALIQVLPCNGTTTKIINEGSVITTPQSIASVQVGKTTWLYALGQDANVYVLNPGANNYSLLGDLTLPAGTHVLALTGEGNLLFALLNSTASGYSVNVYKPDAAGNLGKPTSTVALDPKFTQDGKIPIPVITASNQNLYVVLKDLSNALLLTYSVTNNQLTKTPKQLNISANIAGIAALPNELFLLLAGGSIESLQFNAGSHPLSVLAQQILPPLMIGDQPFTATKEVPVPQKQNSSSLPQSLTIAGATALAAGVVNGIAHLYISDPMNHRIIDLTVVTNASPQFVTSTSTAQSTTTKGVTPTATTTATNLTLQLFQQDVSASFLSQLKSITFDPQAMFVAVLTQTVLTQNNSSHFLLISLSSGLQTHCLTQSS